MAVLPLADLVVSSPLTRTLQTAQLCFAAGAPFVALEGVRETVNYLCDARRHRTALAAEFADVDFSGVAEDVDPVWAFYESKYGKQSEHTGHRESADVSGSRFFTHVRTTV